jgi:hypothetical protein
MLIVVEAERHKKALYSDCHYAECRYAECCFGSVASGLQWQATFDYKSKMFYSVSPPEDMFAFDSLKPTSVVEIGPFVRSPFKWRQQG